MWPPVELGIIGIAQYLHRECEPVFLKNLPVSDRVVESGRSRTWKPPELIGRFSDIDQFGICLPLGYHEGGAGAHRPQQRTVVAILVTAMRRLIIVLLFVGSVAVTTAIAHPGSGIVVDRRGWVYFVDTGGGVWRIEPGGRLVPHGGPKFHWMAMDESGRFSGARIPSIPSAEIAVLGVKPTLLLSSDFPVAVGVDGALYYPEIGADERLRIIRYTPAGARSERAILPTPGLRWLNGLAAGSDGSLYYTEGKAVGKIDARGVVSTLATNVTIRDCVHIPGIEPAAQPYLRGLAVAADGTVFVAATGCGTVVRITPRGEITPVFRTAAPWSPTAVAVSSDGIYIQEYLHTGTESRREWIPRVRKILPDGSAAIIATVDRH